MINWDQIAGNWTQLKGKIKEQYGKLTDDDMTEIEGKAEVMIGKLQERYSVTYEEAEKMAHNMSLEGEHEPAAEQTDDVSNHIDGGKSLLSDAAQYDISTEEGEVSADVSAAEAEQIQREQKEINEEYIHRS